MLSPITAREQGSFQVQFTIFPANDSITDSSDTLPGEFPFAVKEELITNIIKSWGDPVQEVFARAERIFVERLTKLVDHHFGKHAYGGLRGAVM